jgi:hypothetical protein
MKEGRPVFEVWGGFARMLRLEELLDCFAFRLSLILVEEALALEVWGV